MKQSIIALVVAAAAGTAHADILMNEFAPNPDGSDPAIVDFELIGTPGDSFSVVLYELDSDFVSGSVDREIVIDGMFDANGIYNAQIDDLENPSFVLVLSSVSGLLNATVDTDEDGVIDLDFGTVYDALGIVDTESDDRGWAAQLGGVEFAYTGAEPERTFREATTGAWISVNNVFDAAGGIFGADGTVYTEADFDSTPLNYTFGAPNQSFIPAPGAFAAFGLLGGLAAARRRRA